MISPRFGDIFRNNATKTGLVPVVVSPEFAEALMRAVERDPTARDHHRRRRTVGLRARNWPRAEFPLDAFTQHRLLEGLDDIGLTLRHADKITAFESRRPEWMPRVLTA